MILRDSTSQMMILPSTPDEARYLPLGEKASSAMAYPQQTCQRRG